MDFLYLASLVLMLSTATGEITVSFIDSNATSYTDICDLGCKCPEPGQSMLLLDCSNKKISHLPSLITFSTSLTNVNFQENHITSLKMDTFVSAKSIEQLDLSHNQISSIENFTFVAFKSMVLLRLSNNHLQELSPSIFVGLETLKVLELGHNSFHTLWPSVFAGCPNVVELRLQYNPLFDLHEDLFKYMPKIQRLDLESTGLVTLPIDIFRPIPQLEFLSLATNSFEYVPEEALSRASILYHLDLSANDFTRFVSGNFERLSNVSVLHLNYLRKLTHIEKNAFMGLRRLKTFSCSFNPNLVYIDEEAFGSENSTIKAIPREQMYLRQNGLKTLKSPLKTGYWSHMDFVDLADNPWRCDCNLLWMQTLKTETQMNIVCQTPSRLSGRPFSTVGSSDLACQDKWALTTFVLTISGMVAFGLVVMAASAVVCSRTPAGLYVRAKKQFSYAKVDPKTEAVDLEWDPSAETI